MHFLDLLKDKYDEYLKEADALNCIETFIEFSKSYINSNPPMIVNYPQNGLGFILRDRQQVYFETQQPPRTVINDAVPVSNTQIPYHTGMIPSEEYKVYGSR